jgi:DNA-binding MarR family transcriptional regulator
MTKTRALTPRQREVVALIEAQPDITIAGIAAALGVGYSRAWQIVRRLELAGWTVVRRER